MTKRRSGMPSAAGAAALLLAALLGACSKADAPPPAAASAPSPAVPAPAAAAAPAASAPASAPVHALAVQVLGGHVGGQRRGDDTVEVRLGEQVEITFSSDRAIQLHLHGYEVHANVAPQQPGVMAFRAEIAGRFPIHEHREGAGNHRAVLFVEVHP